MSSKFLRINNGLRIEPKSSSDSSVTGSIEVDSATGKVKYYNAGQATPNSPVVTEAHTATLTGKTIDGDDNVVQDLPITAIKTNITDASKFMVRDASGIPTSATKTVPTGVVVGTTDSQVLTSKTIDGDDNTLQDIGLASLKAVVGDINKFIARNPVDGGVISTKAVPTGDVVGTSDSQSLSNKTLASPLITGTINSDVDIVGSLSIDNIDINGNTISSTDVNGDINLTPNGSGKTISTNLQQPEVAVAGPTVASGYGAFYPGSDGIARFKNDDSVVTALGSGNLFIKNQASHGFSSLDGIYHNGANWAKAQANVDSTLAQYVVVKVIDANNFAAVKFGSFNIPSHGKTVGQYYFLSNSTAGASTSVSPTSGYNCPLFYVEDANTIHVVVHRPLSSEALALSGAETWSKYTLSYSELSTAATINTLQLFLSNAKLVVKGVLIKHTTAFTGGAISAYTISVGIVGDLDKYASAFSVFSAASDSNYQMSEVMDTPSFSGTTSIKVTATSTGANLNAASAGSVDIWLLTAQLVG